MLQVIQVAGGVVVSKRHVRPWACWLQQTGKEKPFVVFYAISNDMFSYCPTETHMAVHINPRETAEPVCKALEGSSV